MNKFKLLFLYLMIGYSLLLMSCSDHKQTPQIKKSTTKKLKTALKTDTVLIVTMGFTDNELLTIVGKKITSFYHLPVKYQESYLPQFAYYKPGKRYRADSLLIYLKGFNNGKYRFIAGLTSKDISSTKGDIQDWGICGLANLDGSSCVTSTYRLKRGAKSKAHLIERVEKVILHEIGHNHGLQHCTTPDPCFMKSANGKVSSIDYEPMDICKSCREKMKK